MFEQGHIDGTLYGEEGWGKGEGEGEGEEETVVVMLWEAKCPITFDKDCR